MCGLRKARNACVGTNILVHKIDQNLVFSRFVSNRKNNFFFIMKNNVNNKHYSQYISHKHAHVS